MSYKVVYLPFPDDVYGCVRLLDNGNYLIGINSSLSEDQKDRVLRHELKHINCNHFFDNRELSIIESEAG